MTSEILSFRLGGGSRLPKRVAACIAFAIAGTATADTVYVPTDHTTIQLAITFAGPDDEVIVAPGTYTGTINFGGKSITVRSSDGAGVTTIDGSGLGDSVVRFVSGETVDAVLDGFTIRGGAGSLVDFNGGDVEAGGGILVIDSDPTITNCVISANTADFGAGAFCQNSAAAFWDCVFTGNDSSGGDSNAGAGLYGQNSDLDVDGCDFLVSVAPFGAGIVLEGGDSIVNACLMEGNLATISGGAMFLFSLATVDVTNCLITGNDAGGGGGGILVNGQVGGIFCDVVNCTIYDNTAGSVGGGFLTTQSVMNVHNSILWDNAPDQGHVVIPQLLITYCNVQAGATGTGNINSDPLFFDVDNGDFRLTAASPCVDAGDDTLVPLGITTDFDFRDRFFGSAVDMGAIELGLPGTSGVNVGDAFGWSVAGLGDVNDDGVNDFAVGSPNFNNQRGRLRVFSGADGTVIWTRQGPANGDQMGYAVARSGDLDADGKDDVIVGLPGSDANGVDAGRAYVYSGADASVIHQRKGRAAGDGFGWSVAGGVDIDGDMTDDVIIGAPFNDDRGDDAGLVDVLGGDDFMVNTRLKGRLAGDRFGWSVAGLGDADGAGPDDFVVGAPFSDANGADSGMIIVYHGGTPTTGIYGAVGQVAGDQFGYSLAAMGDLNDDGLGDFVVGANNWSSGRGRVYTYRGDERTRLWIKSGPAGTGHFGTTVASAGDLDCDGVNDVLGAAPDHATEAGADAGLVRVFSGVDGASIMNIGGLDAGHAFGQGLSTLGDLDGDGLDEFLVGAPGGGDSGEGIVCGYASTVSCATGRVSKATGPFLIIDSRATRSVK